MYLLKWIALLWKTEFAMDVWITKDGYSSSSFISAILARLNMSHNIWTSLRHEWSSTGPHCVNVVTVTVKYFKMRVRIHSTHAMDDKIPRLSPSVCAYCKWSKTGSEEGLWMRLGVICWSSLFSSPTSSPTFCHSAIPLHFNACYYLLYSLKSHFMWNWY